LVIIEPVIDNKANILGTLTYGTDIGIEPLQANTLLAKTMLVEKNIYGIIEHNYITDNYFYAIELNRNEHLTLFFIVHGNHVESIAKLLALPQQQINTILKELQDKFLVTDHESLINEAKALGYQYKLPKNLFDQPLSLIINQHDIVNSND